MRRLLIVALLFEAGLLLVVIPWSVFWERNYLASLVPGLQGLVSSPYVRGAVSGLGLINLWLALAELADFFTSRADRRP